MTALEITQITAPLLAAAAAVGGVSVTVRQKDRSERRSEWWRRMVWSLDQVRSDDASVSMTGLAIFQSLLRSTLATDTEHALIRRLTADLLFGNNGDRTRGEEGDHDDDS